MTDLNPGWLLVLAPAALLLDTLVVRAAVRFLTWLEDRHDPDPLEKFTAWHGSISEGRWQR